MIRLLWAQAGAFMDAEVFAKGCEFVERERLAKIQACRQKKDQVRSLCGGLLLQYGFKELLGKKQALPLCLSYEKKENGKPYCKEYPDIYFNLSHSGNLAFLALSDREVGADIQEEREGVMQTAERILTPDEERLYEGLSLAEQKEMFFRLWTIKESYLKLLGTGLSGGMDRVDCDIKKGIVRYPVKEPKSKETEKKETQRSQVEINTARFQEYIPQSGYRACVCLAEMKRISLFPKETLDVTNLLLPHMVW